MRKNIIIDTTDKNTIVEELYFNLNSVYKKKSKRNVRFKEGTEFISSIEYKKFINNFNKIELLNFTGSDASVISSFSINKYNNAVGHNVYLDPFRKPIIQFKLSIPVVFITKWIQLSPNIKRDYNVITDGYIPYIYIPDILKKSFKYILNGSLNEPISNNDMYMSLIKKHYSDSIILYNNLIKNNVDIDTAISILPQSTYIDFIETGSLYDYFLLYKKHNNDLKQPEIHTFVSTINSLLKKKFPKSWETLLSSLNI
jgi:hypothetical protein